VSTIAASTRVGVARARTVAVPTDALALAGLAALAGAMVWFTWATWGDLGRDTGYDLVAGARVAGGELPYVDFVYYYGPLAPALAGLAAWIGGAGLAPMVGLGLALALLVVAATYGLGRSLAGPLGGFLAGAIVVPVALGPSNFSFVLPHSFSATLGILLALVFAMAAGRHASAGGRWWLLGAGIATGLVALTRPEFELAVLAAAAVWLALRWRAGTGGARETLLFSIPAIGIPAVVYGAFAAAAGPSSLVLDNLYPRETLSAAGSSVLRIHAPLTASSFVELGVKLGLYVAGAAVLVLLGAGLARLGNGRRTVALACGTTLFAALCGVAAARPETLRYWLEFAYGWIPAGAAIAVAILLVRYHRRGEGWSPTAQLELVAAVVLAVLAAKTYAAFLVHAPRAQPAVYAVPLAAVFLARLHLVELGRRRTTAALGAVWLAFLAASGVGLTLKDAAAESSSVSGSGGSLQASPADAAAMQPALTLIEASTRPGEPILLAPQLTGLYTLSERENPLPQLSLLPGALPSAADERIAIAALDRAEVRLVVTDGRPFTEYGHTSFGESFDRVLADWIDRNFTRVATFQPGAGGTHTLAVWIRRGNS
jgi:hypothetical protein